MEIFIGYDSAALALINCDLDLTTAAMSDSFSGFSNFAIYTKIATLRATG